MMRIQPAPQAVQLPENWAPGSWRTLPAAQQPVYPDAGALALALLVPVCRANLGRSDANLGARYAAVAQALTGDPDASAQAGLDWIEQTRLLLGVPGLGSYGLLAEQAEEVARGAARASSMQGNQVALSQDELAAIYLAAL